MSHPPISALRQILAIVATATSGKAPLADSPASFVSEMQQQHINHADAETQASLASMQRGSCQHAPESMTASVPSSTALATSVISALVGRGLVIMDSIICVAVITNLPAILAFVIIHF
jgi:hypothetical protein